MFTRRQARGPRNHGGGKLRCSSIRIASGATVAQAPGRPLIIPPGCAPIDGVPVGPAPTMPTGSADGTGRVCRSFRHSCQPYAVSGLVTVAESVCVTVRVVRKCDRDALAEIVGRCGVTIPTVDATDAPLLGMDSAAPAGTPQLAPAARLGTTPLSKRKLKNRICVDYSRAYVASGPRAVLDAFVRELADAKLLVAPPEFRRAEVPYGATTLDREKRAHTPKPKAKTSRSGETPAGVNPEYSHLMPCPIVAPG